MELAGKIVQVVIGLGILNVWLIRPGKQTAWRGGEAKNIREEFAVYGLPPWAVAVVGFCKVALAGALIVGVWVPAVTRPAAIGLAVFMAGAVSMHFKVQDPPRKSLPAFTLLALCLLVALV
jgi:hypothetical protein